MIALFKVCPASLRWDVALPRTIQDGRGKSLSEQLRSTGLEGKSWPGRWNSIGWSRRNLLSHARVSI